jgi:hypothetical protein
MPEMLINAMTAFFRRFVFPQTITVLFLNFRSPAINVAINY